MKVRCLDKRILWFLKYFSAILLAVALVIAAMLIIYICSSLKLYGAIFIAGLVILSLLVVIGIISALSLVYAYKMKRLSGVMLLPFLIGLKVLLPFSVFAAGIIGGEKDSLRRFYIETNNFYTEAAGKKFSNKDIVLLLPHCLQNSSCNIRITKDINMCRNCGRCQIGDIAALLREKGVRSKVVTGGTAARKAIADMRPKAVLAVACERDLASGLAESGKIPVLGVPNIRPYGPCHDTQVDLDLLRKKLETLLESRDTNSNITRERYEQDSRQ